MLAFPGKVRLFLYQEPTDMRKGFEGLSAIVDLNFFGELTSGAYFIFLNRQRNIMKVLYWDADGLAIWSKRLEKGHFAKRGNQNPLLERREFFMLLEGITPRRLQKRYKEKA
jgi:transposase